MKKIKELYSKGYTVKQIASFLKIPPSQVEYAVMEYKFEKLQSPKPMSLVEEILALSKEKRIEYLREFSESRSESLKKDIFIFLKKTKMNYEDIVGIIWIVGEMRFQEFADLLCLHTSSKNGNIKRIVYSSMGKMDMDRFIPYLKMGCKDPMVQVRMYAIKALSKYKLDDKKEFFISLLQRETNSKNKEILKIIIGEDDE
ncbi:MAG: hypothetical protein Q4A75_00575 [Peptostreptococcaceae bacterium]|nr:hypothetical protein [Peptostreptococcaceae bacterium]